MLPSFSLGKNLFRHFRHPKKQYDKTSTKVLQKTAEKTDIRAAVMPGASPPLKNVRSVLLGTERGTQNFTRDKNA